jgi:hypothetical protein
VLSYWRCEPAFAVKVQLHRPSNIFVQDRERRAMRQSERYSTTGVRDRYPEAIRGEQKRFVLLHPAPDTTR